MRITNTMMVNKTIRNINSAANRLSEAEERVSSEKKISLPSDDPVVATRAIKYRNYVDTIEQYQKNVSDVQSWQSVTDDAISSLNDVITQVRTLVAKASSDTTTDSDKADIAAEVSELRDQAIDIMNSTYGGRYIFGGYSTDTAPYELVTNAVSAFTAGTGSYSAASLSLSGDLTAGDYNLGITASGGTYTVTLTDSSGSTVATGTTASSTGSVTLKTASGGTVTLAAPSGGYSDGDGFSFSIASVDQVTFKGKYLTTTFSSSLSTSTMDDVYATGGVYSAASPQSIKYNIGYGSDLVVNTEGQDVVGSSTGDNLFDTFAKIIVALNGESTYQTYDAATNTATTKTISKMDDLITDLDNNVDMLTTAQAALGASENHVNNVADRLSNDYTTYKTLMSNNEDVDASKATIEESTAQTVYEAALSVGAKAISKTLVDYMV